MATVTVDFGKSRGAVRPMHAVNNGPAGAADGISNAEAFWAAGIPYVRLHDSAHCWEYGGEFSVDVHPGRMNGLFDTDFLQPLKSYYAFKMFDRLYRLKNAAETESDETAVYACAAGTRTGEKAVLISRFDDDDTAPPEDVTIRVRGADGAHKATVYLLDGDNDMQPVRGETLPGNGAITLTLKNFDTVLIEMEPV